jgi:monoamine oxidase
MGDATTSNGMSDDKKPLKVIIVGGGIGGLTAAIGLRKQGHNVLVSYQLNRCKFWD